MFASGGKNLKEKNLRKNTGGRKKVFNKNKNKNNKLMVARVSCRESFFSKNKKQTVSKKIGSVSVELAVMAFLFFSCIFYLVSINSSAIKGQEIRRIEKELTEIKKTNEKLLTWEAEFNSFYRIEETALNLNFSDLDFEKAVFLEEKDSLAFNKK